MPPDTSSTGTVRQGGDTLLAPAKLAEMPGAVVHECAVVIELPALGGCQRLRGFSVYRW